MRDVNERHSLLIATSLTVLVGMVWSWRWLDLFPLIEFRQQIEFALPFHWLLENILLSGENIWSIPFYFNSMLGQTCGTELYCLNGSLLAIVIATGLMITLLLKRMGFRWKTSVLAGILWQIGLPVLDSMAWQATNLDKISALLVVIGMHAGLFWLRRVKSGYGMFLCSTSLLLLTALAYNTKPAAWVLIPTLILLPIVERGVELRRWFICLTVPTIYAALRSAKTLYLVANDTFYLEHISKGDLFYNAWTFFGILCGSNSGSIAPIIVVVLVSAIIIYGTKFRIARYQAGIFSLICLAGSITIALRTQYANPFYMLVPSIFMVMAIAAICEIVIEDRRMWWRRGIFAISLSFAVIFIINILDARKQYEIVDQQSTSFRQSLAIAETYLNGASVDQITFVVDGSNYLAYKFVSGGALEAYIFSQRPKKKIRYIDITRTQWHGGVPADRTAYLVFDFQMNIVEIVVNGENVFTST
jgi:hypothetical protein